MSELKVYVKPIKTNMFGKMIVGQSYYLKSEADKVIAEKDRELRHQKYKRCLDMAKYCKAMCGHYLSYEEPKWFWYRKWSERLLELAEKFKEAK